MAGTSLEARARRANAALSKLPCYHATLGAGVDAVGRAVEEAGLVIDRETADGIYCGEEGRSQWALVGCRRGVQMTWYRMPSGRYEVVAYVS